jgi:hypothetical protein
MVNPLYAYRHDAGRQIDHRRGLLLGQRFPSTYANDYFFGDYVGNYIKRYDMETGQVIDFATETNFVVDLTVGPDGALYWLNVEGKKVGRIDYGSTATPPPRRPRRFRLASRPSRSSTAGGGTTLPRRRHDHLLRARDGSEDGTLGAASLTWEVLFHHDTTRTPFYGPSVGYRVARSPSLTTGEASANTCTASTYGRPTPTATRPRLRVTLTR